MRLTRVAVAQLGFKNAVVRFLMGFSEHRLDGLAVVAIFGCAAW